MSYRPWCPKCGDPLYLDETHYPPTVGCWCGFRLVNENHIRAFVAEQQQQLERSRQAAPEPPEPTLAPKPVVEFPAPSVAPERVGQVLTALDPQPTRAQLRRGARHRVTCSVCDKVLFRRLHEVQKGAPFFCGRDHQNQWKRDHPVGCVQKVS